MNAMEELLEIKEEFMNEKKSNNISIWSKSYLRNDVAFHQFFEQWLQCLTKQTFRTQDINMSKDLLLEVDLKKYPTWNNLQSMTNLGRKQTIRRPKVNSVSDFNILLRADYDCHDVNSLSKDEVKVFEVAVEALINSMKTKSLLVKNNSFITVTFFISSSK